MIMRFARNLSPEVALGIATGVLCPLSKAKMVDIAPDAQVLAGPPLKEHTSDQSIKTFFSQYTGFR